MISILRGRQIVEDWQVWRRQPDVYLNPGMSGIFGLFLHQLRPMEELVDAAVARMALIPGNLEDGERNLRPELVPAIFLDRAANQARAGARYVREILPAQIDEGPLRARMAEAGEAAGSAYDGVRRLPRGDAPERDRGVGAGGGAVQRAAAREGAPRIRRPRAAGARPTRL